MFVRSLGVDPFKRSLHDSSSPRECDSLSIGAPLKQLFTLSFHLLEAAPDNPANSVIFLSRRLRFSIELKVAFLKRDVAAIGGLRRHMLERVLWPLLLLSLRLLVCGGPFYSEARSHRAQVVVRLLFHVVGNKHTLFGNVLKNALLKPVIEPSGKVMLVAKMFQCLRPGMQRSDKFDSGGGGCSHGPLVPNTGLCG